MEGNAEAACSRRRRHFAILMQAFVPRSAKSCEELPSMTARFTSVVRLCLVLTTGMSASLAAGEGGVTGTPSGWKQHDTKRPSRGQSNRWTLLPQAARPGRRSSCSMARTSTPGKPLKVKPAGWKVADGEMVIAPGAGEIQTKGSLRRHPTAHRVGSRRHLRRAPVKTAATAASS